MADRAELALENSRFYDSLKSRLVGWLANKLGKRISAVAEMALLVPDILVLLGRVLLDKRIPRKLRIKVGVVLAYVSCPLDIIPESVVGPLGLIDDLVLLAFALDKVFAEVDEDLLAEHWSGSLEHLGTLRDLADIVNGIFTGRVGASLNRWYEEEVPEGGAEKEGEGIGPGRIELVSEEKEDEAETIERLRASGL
jgi:uncharacterized membrane protein YkvA (DUF1232 family)